MSVRGRVRHCYRFDDFHLEPDNHLLWHRRRVVDLSPKAFDLLFALVEDAGCVLTKDHLLKRVWPNTFVDENNLPRTISTLREAFRKADGLRGYIETVPKRGYRFVALVRKFESEGHVAESPCLASVPVGVDLLPRVEDVRSVLSDIAAHRLTTIVAPSGFGKTSLAILVASEVQQTGAPGLQDGCWFVPCESLAHPDDERSLTAAISSVLGEDSDHNTVPALVRLLRNKDLLLILDACETALDHCETIVSKLLLACPNLKVLATSRRPLGVSGEKVHRLSALALPEERTDEWPALDGFLCISLFKKAAARHGFALVEDAATATRVVTICRLAEGVPLNIELTASMTCHHCLEEIIEGLRRDSRLGGSQESKLHRRLSRSFRLLPGPARTLFRRLAIFVGSFTKEAAGAVCSGNPSLPSESAISLQHLVESSLLTRTGSDNAYYRMLGTTRSFALSILRESGEAEALSRSHFIYYRRLSEEVGQKVIGRDVSSALAVMETGMPNILRALDWSLNHAPDDGTALCGALWPYWVVAGQMTEGRERLKAFLALSSECSTATLARALTGLGVLAYFQSDYEEGIKSCEQALNLASRVGDRWASAINQIASGSMRFHHGHEYETAFCYFADSTRTAFEMNDPWLLSLALGNSSMHRALVTAKVTINVPQQTLSDILEDSARSVLLAREVGSPWLLALALMNRAMTLRCLHGVQALDSYEALILEAFQLRLQMNDKYGMIQSLYKLAATACERRLAAEYIRAAILLGGVHKLMGGRERIPIPKLNEADFLWTVNSSKSVLGDEAYQRYFLMGVGLSIPEVIDLAFAPSVRPKRA